MKCPVCAEPDLVMSERQGIEVDYCPKCRGVWLDRGELDKIIERAPAGQAGYAQSGHAPAPYAAAPYPERRGYDRDDDDDDDDRRRYPQGGYEGYPGHRRKRRESWLGDLFDFG